MRLVKESQVSPPIASWRHQLFALARQNRPQVHALLLQAAAETKGVEKEPAPFVLQTALNDFYVEYELNVTTREPGSKPRTYSDLHANILNAFGAARIEIMSPHYEARRDGSEPALPPTMEAAPETGS